MKHFLKQSGDLKVFFQIILKSLVKKFRLKSNNFFLFKNKNKTIELNQDDIEVATGIIIKPISLK